jgi:S1-C subfamily serine protease
MNGARGRSPFLLPVVIVCALVFLAWLAFAARDLPNPPPLPPPAPAPATVLATTPAPGAPPQPAPAVTVPASVTEAAEQRQSAKITRGMSASPGGGIRIDEVPPGSVVAEMHLQPGDLLKSANNQTLSSPEDFARLYRAEGMPGEFVVVRDGRELHRR